MRMKSNIDITEAFEKEEKEVTIDYTRETIKFRLKVRALQRITTDKDFELLQCKIISHTNELRELQKEHKKLTGRNLVVF